MLSPWNYHLLRHKIKDAYSLYKVNHFEVIAPPQSQGLTRWSKHFTLRSVILGLSRMGSFVKRDYQGFRGIVYVVCMVLFWFWLYGFSYTVQVDKNEIRILRILLGRVTRTFVIRKAEIDGIMNQI